MKNIALTLILGTTILNTNAQAWEPSIDFPGSERHHPVTFAIDNIGYALTGMDVQNFVLKDFYAFNFDTQEWSQLDDFPGPARSFSISSVSNNTAYMGFGLGTLNVLLNDFWKFEVTTGQWTQLASCPCPGRRHPALVATDEKVYVGMGDTGASNLRDWWEYDINSDSWTKRDDLPGSVRHHPFQFGIDNVPYVGFGHAGQLIFDDFYKFDPQTLQWVQLNDFPDQGRVAGTQFSYNGKGYVLSGQDETHQNFNEGEFWEYEPETDSWTQLPSHPGSSRWAPGSFVIDGVIHFLAGRSGFSNAPQVLEKDMMTYSLNPFVSANELAKHKDVQYFPNPVVNELNILGDVIIERIDIYDLQGKLVNSFIGNQRVLNLGNLAPGFYIIDLKTTDNQAIKHKIIRS